MDPLFAQLAMLFGQNPQLGGQLMAGLGAPSPAAGGGGGLPAFMPPGMAQAAQEGEFASLLAPGGYPTPMSPAQAGMKDAGAGAGGQNPFQALQGFKAPMADNKPIMNAGVSGSQRAPEVTIGAAGGRGGSAAIQALMAQLIGGVKPAPGLGDILGRIG